MFTVCITLIRNCIRDGGIVVIITSIVYVVCIYAVLHRLLACEAGHIV